MIDEIDAKFHIRGKPVIYSWGDILYNPMRITIPLSLINHEMVHGEQQKEWGIEQWWEDYIASVKFRLDQEVMAHAVEYLTLITPNPGRQRRRRALILTAKRLAGPLYGKITSVDKAKRLILEEIKP